MILFDSAARNCAVSVSSKNPDSSASLEAQFVASVQRLTRDHAENLQLLIALSGGVDSVVLLALAARFRQSNRCELRAVYVDHGLQSQSPQWGTHCASLCDALDVAFESIKVKVDLQSGLSPEAAARDARYSALNQVIKPDEYLCAAQHADDQAETLLLQLLRGAGVQGLASMPELREFGAGYLMRPLLRASRGVIVNFAEHHKLTWCEDPSNADSRFDRNFLRNEILPLLQSRWPQLSSNISRSATHCADAAALADELARLDCGDPHGQLSVRHIRSLSVVRQKNLVRYWINHHGFKPPSTVQLQQILNDLVCSTDDSQGRINFGDAQMARYHDLLFVGQRDSFEPLPAFEYQWVDSLVPLMIKEVNWQLDASSHKRLEPYAGKPLLVRNRRGGERWRADPAGQSVSVKSLLQQRRIPPWQRSRLLLVFHGENLVDICAPEFVL